MNTPYWTDGHITLYCGDIRDVLPQLDLTGVHACIADPPYGETSLSWDKWPAGWPSLLPASVPSLWCFGSMRMFLARRDEFVGWKFAQDVVWEKHNGSGFAADRFKRVHETVAHFYRGVWGDVHQDVPREPRGMVKQTTSHGGQQSGRQHTGEIGDGDYTSTTRLVRSVIRVRSLNGCAIHPTEKPAGILDPLIRYSVPVGGAVLDLFGGSCSTSLTARSLGRNAIAIEADEAMCERAVRERLDVPDLFGGAA